MFGTTSNNSNNGLNINNEAIQLIFATVDASIGAEMGDKLAKQQLANTIGTIGSIAADARARALKAQEDLVELQEKLNKDLQVTFLSKEEWKKTNEEGCLLREKNAADIKVLQDDTKVLQDEMWYGKFIVAPAAILSFGISVLGLTLGGGNAGGNKPGNL